MTQTTATAAPTAYTPIVKTVTVRATPEKAFRRFTAEMGSWWPLASHSVGQARSEGIDFDGRIGGQIIERIRGGETSVWGTVTAWDPPRRVAFTWHPGSEPEKYQDIELIFEPDGDHTRVTLTHTGFERLGDEAARARKGYPLGWAYVLGVYAQQRGPFMLLMFVMTEAMMITYRFRNRNKA